MPIVHVRGTQPDDSIQPALSALARAVAAACECPVEDVWCTFTPVAAMTLGTHAVSDQGRIVYVDLIMRPRDADQDARALQAATVAAAAGFSVPLEDVWARLSVVEPGRVFAGGGLLAW